VAIGKGSDFKIHDEFYNSGRVEGVAQAIDGIGALGGAIALQEANHAGNYAYDPFFQLTSSLVTRRDLTSVSGVTDLALSQEEEIAVKINRKVGPIAITLDAFKKISRDPEEASFILGRQHAQVKMQDMINTGLIAAEAAIQGNSAMNYDYSGTGTITHGAINSALAKFSDRSNDIAAGVLRGKVFHDLVGQAITDKVADVANVAIMDGGTFLLGRRFMVTDAGALFDANGSLTDTYNSLFLVPGALAVEESEPETVAFEMITGLDQLVYRYQAEYSYSVRVKGFKWDVSNGGANPTDATLGTTTNWDQVATDDKDTAGVRLVTQ
jgi:hypothetical protein